MSKFLRRLAGRCDTHDRAAPLTTARLEADTGIDSDAVTKLLESSPSLVDSFANPDLIDCGNPRCRKRREEQR